MAPVVPSKRRSLRAKLTAKSGSEPYAKPKASRPGAAETLDSFANTKRDKRQVKHASFVSRIEKANNKKTLKRRRPGKKLVTNLDSLAAALPDLLADGETEEGLKQMREGKVRHKSLRSRPGALKKKERLVKGEVERFGVSLARLNAVPEQQQQQKMMDVDQDAAEGGKNENEDEAQALAPAAMSTTNRWAALRGFISATMEQNPAFVGKQDGK
ncbi:ribosome biogenesis protein SLX9-domain-containing protein [Hypoxylon rubiginosum]|uniref:Ribosome biogenesis protein SLX9-domain-containing protein n=1 Tax=Hypoxylon rubiginosum TaxID=110542 RepID=A0ACC0DLG2_9PEZI|nr:ribosome biogenesis protein SLX9-domain-containing protein [Hypoxylon rubiginosum]